jgi:hypothetical protein
MAAKAFFFLGAFLLLLMGFSVVALDENAWVYSMFGVDMNSARKSQIEIAGLIAGASMIKFGHAAYVDMSWEAIGHYASAFLTLSISIYVFISSLWSA